MGSRFALRVLGVPSFERDGEDLHLPSRRVLALLATLAVDGRTTRARLASTFWSETDDKVARRNLRRELARLREAGLGETFEADLESVRLGAAVGTDAAPFEAACERDDPVAALAVWRGPLLDGFALGGEAPAFDAWLTERRDSLARKWRKAAADFAARREAAGDGRAALEWHLRLLAEDPLQELHHANAMRLHHLLGERAAALAVFERCRRLLDSELGLEPLASTTALAEAIRAAERVAPLVARRASGAGPLLDAPLVGRAAHLAALRERRAAIVLLQGEAGVGKTRLVQECLLARATLSVRCEAVAQGAPLHAIAEALRTMLERSGAMQRLETLAAADRREAARLLPVLDPDARFDAHPDNGIVGRSRFFNAIGEVIDRLVGRGGTLWIDDLHWSDEASLALLAQLAHRHAAAPEAHVHIVAAARGEELELHASARDALLALERSRLLVRVPVAPLGDAETLELVRALAGIDGGALFSARLQQATGGNPYHLLETIRFLFDTGELQVDLQGGWVTRYDDATTDYAELPVPPTLAATVIERVDRLGAPTRRMLETAALTSAGFVLEQVQPATALGEWEALEGLERAVKAQLLVSDGSGYRFVHDLAREALAGRLGPERRRLIHGRLAGTLIERKGRADLIAMHLEGADRQDEAVDWRIRAGRDAERLFAWRDAHQQYDRALAIGVDEARLVGLRRSRIAVLRTLHDLPGVQAELDALDALAAGADDGPLALEVLSYRTELAIKRHRYTEAVDHARRAWAHPDWDAADEAIRRRALGFGAFALVENAHYDEALTIYQRELASADPGAGAWLATLHHGMANYHSSFAHDELAFGHFRSAASGFAAAGDDEGRLRAENMVAYSQYVTGDPAAAMATMQRVLDEGERLHHISLLRVTLLNFILYALETGDGERAARQLARAETLLQGVDDPATQCRLQIRVSEVAAQRGDLGRAVRAARTARTQIEANGGGLPDFWPWFVLSRLLWWIGDHVGAARVYDDLPGSPAWLPTAPPAVKFFATAWALPGDRSAATGILESIEPAPGVLVQDVLIDFFRALALHRLGRDEEALALLEPPAADKRRNGFVLRKEDHLALRIDVRSALRLDTTMALAEAGAMLPAAAPLLALRLHRSAAAALRAAGHKAMATTHAKTARQLARHLAESLADEPELRSSFEREHLQRPLPAS